jgi:hypothetical protein
MMNIDDGALRNCELRTVGLGVRSAQIRDTHGREVKITMYPLASERREKLIAAVHTAYSRLKDPNEFGLDKEMFAVAVRATAYAETDAEGIGPFAAAGGPANPITILHRHSSLWDNETELCVAVLHEAVHLLDSRSHNADKKDRRTGWAAEAIHNRNCYAALDYDIPSGHPAFGLSPAGESESATPDRKGPCPCGSGKKYKRCCG